MCRLLLTLVILRCIYLRATEVRNGRMARRAYFLAVGEVGRGR